MLCDVVLNRQTWSFPSSLVLNLTLVMLFLRVSLMYVILWRNTGLECGHIRFQAEFGDHYSTGEDAVVQDDKVKLRSHQKERLELCLRVGAEWESAKGLREECTLHCWQREISMELRIRDHWYHLVGFVYKGKLFQQGSGSCKLMWQESSSCCCLVTEVTHNTQVIYVLGRIWNCVPAGLALLDVPFPTTSPSGDRVLQSYASRNALRSMQLLLEQLWQD